MKLVIGNDPILKEECKEFDFANPPFDPSEFAKNLVQIMYDNNGIGLSANQVGVPYKIFAMRGTPADFVCFNPRIVMPSNELITLEESCLSFPGLIIKIKRPRHVRVRFQGPSGETVTQQFTGMTARVFQHEMDYVNGFLFYTRANRFHREKAFKKCGII
jgi:peptide deformylase